MDHYFSILCCPPTYNPPPYTVYLYFLFRPIPISTTPKVYRQSHLDVIQSYPPITDIYIYLSTIIAFSHANSAIAALVLRTITPRSGRAQLFLEVLAEIQLFHVRIISADLRARAAVLGLFERAAFV